MEPFFFQQETKLLSLLDSIRKYCLSLKTNKRCKFIGSAVGEDIQIEELISPSALTVKDL